MGATTKIKPGYKVTKAGRIPDDWEISSLDDAAEFLDGKRKPIKEKDRELMKGEYPYYGASGIIDYVNDFIFDDNLILLGEDGANILTRSTQLAFQVLGKFWVNNHAHVLKPKDEFNIGYLTEYLESINYVKYNSGTAQPKLNKQICAKIPIVKPPLPEQKKIADILSTWDKAIETTQALVHKLKLRKKGLMQQLLTGKKRLPGFKGEWEECVFSDVSNRLTKKNTELDDNVITISAQRGFIRQEDYFNKRVASKTLSGYYLIDKGQFAYNKSYSKGYPMGAFKRLDDFDKAVVTTLYICFEITEKANSDFMVYYFEGGMLVRNLMKIAQEGGRAHGLLNISLGDFFGLKMTLPSTEEQTAIAQVLTKADEEINRTQNYLEQLQEQKKGLMQQLLTGQRRVVV